ncbi:MAG: cell division protein FtsK, partial [Phycisphaerae bacterium]|nr:cell division protein FtsK [Phycisphaerae bacterium]
MPDATERLDSVLSSLRLAVHARASEEKALVDAIKADRTKNDRLRDSTLAAIKQRLSDETRAERERYATRKESIESGAESDLAQLAQEERNSRLEIEVRTEENISSAQKKMEETVWLAETVYEGAENQPRLEYERTREEMAARREELDAVEEEASRMIHRYRQPVPHAHQPATDLLNSTLQRPDSGLLMQFGRAQESLRVVKSLRVAGLFRGPILLLPALCLIGAGVGGAALLRGTDGTSLGVGAGVGAALFVVLTFVLFGVARREIVRAHAPLSEALILARACMDRIIEIAAESRKIRERELVETRDRDVAEATAKFQPLADEFHKKRLERLAKLDAKIPVRRKEIEDRRVADRAENEALHERRMREIDTTARDATAAEETRHANETAAIDERERLRFAALKATWDRDTTEGLSALDRAIEIDRSLFQPWTDPTWNSWTGSTTAPDSIRLGTLRFDLAACEGGLSKDPRLAVAHPTALDVPAVLAFPHRSSLLIETDLAGRAEAIDLVQTVLLRLLARVPPSKVRLVLIDPVGLGQSFAGFMHLADEMEALVGDRIWTEPRHIEQKLTDLTEHMETVIQKYLRNEFDSIEAYNEKAGEIAEPLRYLVITDFPTNITDIAAKRLQSILASGAKCGVHTIIVRTSHGGKKAELPAGISEEDLRQLAVVLTRQSGTPNGNKKGNEKTGERDRFVVEGEEFSRWPFDIDPAPPADLLMSLVKRIGRAAKDAGRVEVPFATVAPKVEPEWWSESSSKRVRVPLGRAGASKLQFMTLGEGTAQHALIAGKTGSGKSTLLHALVTSLACWYSPDEIEFYLIDFKKGVEFKTYATHKLPHARAVAIESDREFGLSVLQGLDGELKRRGDLFRDLGVQDLNGYRRMTRGEGGVTTAAEPMPRVLLIVDEFQELFVEDDKVGQESSLLLDRLVRQGRAFGIHVILGSQTLGGAYSIARATMGQMGVRIALQCNEADSQLILSDDNSAARLLSRPGEAIYNDASGLMEGNSPFQVVWLPEDVRERYLARAAELASKRSRRTATIVFEGNIPADPDANAKLISTLQAPFAPEKAPVSLWLGDAIAIKDPTAAVFRRQAGANLIVVGQQDIGSTSLVAMSILSIAMQRSPADARFVILDGTPADDPKSGLLASVAKALPHDAVVVPWRDTEDAVRGVAEVVAKRQTEGDERQSVFLVVHGLQRYRQLRRNEDDFGFGGSGDGPVPTDKLFAGILKEGAPLGVHVITWVDTVANAQRALDRNAMREFDWRAMFQLSQTDS